MLKVPPPKLLLAFFKKLALESNELAGSTILLCIKIKKYLSYLHAQTFSTFAMSSALLKARLLSNRDERACYHARA